MLLVTAVVRPQRAELLCQRLLAAGWADEVTASECRGYGRQKGHLESYQGVEYAIEFLPKIQVEAVIPDERKDDCIGIVLATCRTGRIGDGKIFVRAMP